MYIDKIKIFEVNSSQNDSSWMLERLYCGCYTTYKKVVDEYDTKNGIMEGNFY